MMPSGSATVQVRWWPVVFRWCRSECSRSRAGFPGPGVGPQLVFAMTYDGHGERAIASIGGLCGSVMVVHVPHQALAQALGEGADVESFLQGRLTLAQAPNLER